MSGRCRRWKFWHFEIYLAALHVRWDLLLPALLGISQCEGEVVSGLFYFHAPAYSKPKKGVWVLSFFYYFKKINVCCPSSTEVSTHVQCFAKCIWVIKQKIGIVYISLSASVAPQSVSLIPQTATPSLLCLLNRHNSFTCSHSSRNSPHSLDKGQVIFQKVR